jgi:phosphoribosylglycinamide formyltransferase 1
LPKLDPEYDKKTIATLEAHSVDPKEGLIVLAGYFRILSPHFVQKYHNRIMNVHPALLPSFSGLDPQKRALEYGVKVAGATIHFVANEVDAGPIILQAHVPVRDDDTVETLSQRILRQEHRLYPEAIRLFTEEKLKIEGRRVLLAT